MNEFEPQKMLQLFIDLLKFDVWKYARKRKKLRLPVFSADLLKKTISATRDVFAKEQSMLNVQSPVTVVGDLHGNLLDLLTIFKKCGLPPDTRYIFLGDLIDRGEFSLETIIFIYLLKICYPKEIFIIRGNHELRGVCLKFGFSAEIKKKYTDDTIFQEFSKTFGYTPIAALIDSTILCIHGGIGPCVNSIKEIAAARRPMRRVRKKLPSFDILWSDPCDDITEYQRSHRGYGHLFGKEHCIEFEKNNSLSLIIRGHEVATNGVNYCFDGRIITVFSASNYCNMYNDGGIVEVLPGAHINAITYKPYPRILLATDTFFYNAFDASGKKTKFVPPTPEEQARSPSVPRTRRRRIKRAKSEIEQPVLVRSKSLNGDIKNVHIEMPLSACGEVFNEHHETDNMDLYFPDSAVEMPQKRRRMKRNIPQPPNPMRISHLLHTENVFKNVGCEESESDAVSEMPSPSVIDGINRTTSPLVEIPFSSARRSKSAKGVASPRKRKLRKRMRSPDPQPVQDSTATFISITAKPPKKKRRRAKAKIAQETVQKSNEDA